jgi:catechol 2,3-dioxygenase-like lactoylglutathione lyase family enzyme
MATGSPPSVPGFDHAVVDVQDRIDEAARRYRALGFRLTDRGRHSMGSVNHLAMFGTDYLELLGTGDAGGPVRQELLGFPVGLNGLVFKLDDADRFYAALKARGLPVQPVNRFARPLLLDGKQEEARFHTVRLEPRTVFDGRLYFCQHLTPQFVWRPEWQEHPNGAVSITRLVIAARDPARVAAAFARMFGAGASEPGPGGARLLRAGAVRIEIVPHASLAADLGEGMPEAAGRSDYLALLGLRVRSLPRAADCLRSGGIVRMRSGGQRLLVHPAEAMNVALEFSE